MFGQIPSLNTRVPDQLEPNDRVISPSTWNTKTHSRAIVSVLLARRFSSGVVIFFHSRRFGADVSARDALSPGHHPLTLKEPSMGLPPEPTPFPEPSMHAPQSLDSAYRGPPIATAREHANGGAPARKSTECEKNCLIDVSVLLAGTNHVYVLSSRHRTKDILRHACPGGETIGRATGFENMSTPRFRS